MSGGKNEERPPLGTEGAQENNGGDRDPCKVKEDIPANGGAGDQNCLLSDPEKVRDALAWLRPAGQWSLHSKANEGPFRGRQFADLGAAARWAGGENAGAATNVYIALADLREGFTGTKAKDIDVVSSRWLWVDLDPDKKDARPFAVKRAELLARLTTDLPKEVPAPSAIIDSGGGYWGLWRLAAPMNPDEVRLRLKWLAERMKGDKTTDPSRIIRLPGTVNRPDAAKVAAGQRPALAHFVRRDVVEYTPAAFGGPAVAPAAAPVAEVDVEWGDLPRFASPHEIEGLSPRIQAVIAQGDDAEEPYQSRSHALFAVLAAMVRAGFSDTQIAGVVTDPNFEVCAYLYDPKGKKLTPAERRMTPKVMASTVRQIKNARKKVAAEDTTAARRASDSRPVVVVDYNRLHLMLNAAEDALLASGLALYQRAGAVVAPVRHPRGSLRLREVSATAMREMMTTAADFTEEGIDKDGRRHTKPAYPEPHFTQAYVERAAMGTCRLPECNGLVGHPTIRPDGSLLWAEGFDSDTGLIVDYGGVSFPPVPDTPTRDEAVAALAKLKEVIKGFPFVDDASRSVALSAILTAVCRRSLDFAPAHAFNAPSPETGKSLLSDIPAMVATGHPAAKHAQEKDPEEDQKSLLGVLMQADPVVVIDNVDRPVEGATWCLILTTPEWEKRGLGGNANKRVLTNVLFIFNGNNIEFRGDMATRAVMATIDAGVEEPAARAFDVDLREDVPRRRGELVSAALTVLRAHVVAGLPGAQRDTRFGGWSRLVRGALVWLGEADPWDTRHAVRGGDSARDEVVRLMDALEGQFSDEPFSARAVCDAAAWDREGNPQDKALSYALADMVPAVTGPGPGPNATKLGYALKRMKDRVVRGRTIVFAGKDKVEGNMWRIVRRGDS